MLSSAAAVAPMLPVDMRSHREGYGEARGPTGQ